MRNDQILGTSNLIAFAPVTDYARAREFYGSVLGLSLLSDEAPFALVFSANGVMLRVTKVGAHKPAPFTVLGWDVEDIDSAVKQLTAAGVNFLRFAGLNDNAPLGIWASPGGARVAWFNDPDKNVLSLTQFPK